MLFFSQQTTIVFLYCILVFLKKHYHEDKNKIQLTAQFTQPSLQVLNSQSIRGRKLWQKGHVKTHFLWTIQFTDVKGEISNFGCW